MSDSDTESELGGPGTRESTSRPDALSWLEDDSAILVLGARRSGKSVLIKDICCHMRGRFPLVIVFTGTKMNNWFAGWLPNQCVFEGYHERVVVQLLARQRRILAENAGRPLSQQSDPRVLVILDDVVTEREAQNSRALQTLYVSGRHHKVSVLFSTQYVRSKTVPPVIRGNCDLVFVFAQSSEEASSIIAEQWLSGVGDKREGVALLHKATRERRHQTLVVNSRLCTFAKSYADFTTTYVADPSPPRFRMCSPYYWGASDPLKSIPRKRWYHVVVSWFSTSESPDAEEGDKVPPPRKT
jgi:hypothetical protein